MFDDEKELTQASKQIVGMLNKMLDEMNSSKTAAKLAKFCGDLHMELRAQGFTGDDATKIVAATASQMKGK